MTKEEQRRYYIDAYTTAFSARVVERIYHKENTAVVRAVVLDQTYFYPDSGGQPADMGWLGAFPVADVTVREGDEAVLHWFAENAEVADADLPVQVVGKIDWSRRFDHMQQHTGQHILSRAFINTAEAETVSFHLGQEGCTIDLALPHGQPLTAVDVQQAEQLANQLIWQNRPITARFVTQEEAATLPLRKQPEVSGSLLRLVQIAEHLKTLQAK